MGVTSGTIKRNGTQSCSRRLRLGAGSAPSRVWPVLTVPFGGGRGGREGGKLFPPPLAVPLGCISITAQPAPSQTLPAALQNRTCWRQGQIQPTGGPALLAAGNRVCSAGLGPQGMCPFLGQTPWGRHTWGGVSYLIPGDHRDSFGQQCDWERLPQPKPALCLHPPSKTHHTPARPLSPSS